MLSHCTKCKEKLKDYYWWGGRCQKNKGTYKKGFPLALWTIQTKITLSESLSKNQKSTMTHTHKKLNPHLSPVKVTFTPNLNFENW